MESGAISSLLTKGDTGYDSISLECNGVIEQVVRFTKQGIKLGIMLDNARKA